MSESKKYDAIIIGGGLAGLSAAIYLGRARRDTLVIDAGHPMANWEPQVENFLGFPEGIAGDELLKRGRIQAERFGVCLVQDVVEHVRGANNDFEVVAHRGVYQACRVLVATGIYHIPPDIPGVTECMGRSLFFCKDCDGYRVRGKEIAILGNNDDAVEYALGMIAYSPCVMIATNGEAPIWDDQHEAWIKEYAIPVNTGRIVAIEHEGAQICALCIDGGRRVAIDYAFTTRGDLFHSQLARELGAEVDHDGQIVVDRNARTSVPGLYAAGCVTPANCQMIIAAGQGAIAAQAINRDLFEQSLATHSLERYRQAQIQDGETLPEILN